MKAYYCLVLAIPLLAASPASGQTLNFDSLPTVGNATPVPTGYDGFDWTTPVGPDPAFSYYSTGDGLPYNHGIVSMPNAGVIYDQGGFHRVSGGSFNLISVSLTLLDYGTPSVPLTVQGLNSLGTVVDSQTVTVTNTATKFTFNFYGIASVEFNTSDYLSLDNIYLGPVATSFESIPGLNGNERGIATQIDNASSGSGTAITHIVTALSTLPVTEVAGALDQLSTEKVASFYSATAFNNAAFETEDMDSYLAGMRGGAQGGFAEGAGGLDSHGLVVNDPNVDPGLQMIHSRMLAWNDPISTLTDVPGAILGGIEMKDPKAMAKSCPACTGEGKPWDVFVRGNVVLGQGFSQQDQPHYDDNTESVVVGADYHVTSHFLAGVTASYAHTDATLDDAGSSATVDSYSPGLYASYADGGWYGNFVGRYSHNTYSEARAIPFLGQTASGGTDGNEGVADLDGGYDFHSGAWTYGPVAGVQYTHLTVDGYAEGGSDASLQVNRDESDSLRSRLGGSVRFDVAGCGMHFSPHLTATWEHEFLDESRGVTSQFTNFSGGSFVVRTPGASDDFALADAGIDAQVCGNITVFGDYMVQAGQSNYFGQSVQAGVRINF